MMHSWDEDSTIIRLKELAAQSVKAREDVIAALAAQYALPRDVNFGAKGETTNTRMAKGFQGRVDTFFHGYDWHARGRQCTTKEEYTAHDQEMQAIPDKYRDAFIAGVRWHMRCMEKQYGMSDEQRERLSEMARGILMEYGRAFFLRRDLHSIQLPDVQKKEMETQMQYYMNCITTEALTRIHSLDLAPRASLRLLGSLIRSNAGFFFDSTRLGYRLGVVEPQVDRALGSDGEALGFIDKILKRGEEWRAKIEREGKWVDSSLGHGRG